MKFKAGDMLYKRRDFEADTYIVEGSVGHKVKVLNQQTGSSSVIQSSYLATWYTTSKTILLREILFDIDEVRDKIITELGEYDLRVLLGDINPETNDKSKNNS